MNSTQCREGIRLSTLVKNELPTISFYVVLVRRQIICATQSTFADLILSKYYINFVLISVVSTSTPSNEAELQLYRVLQKASLLAYYDTLLEMGKCKKQIESKF